MNARPRFGLMPMTLLAVLLFSTCIATRQVQANSGVNVNISIFHDALAPYGNWVNHRTYGQVWYPRNVSRNWRPYTDGYWAHTHDYGWLWVSNEPWGWAPFHYGRWAWDNWYGWVWVPGRTWAPAWVFWRSGGGYAAWAPMPPNVVWQPGIGLNISYFNYDRDLNWDSWVAVREYDLPHQHINRHILPPNQNRQVINVTNNTTNITLINNTIVNQGVPVKQIEAITRKPVISVVPNEHDSADINAIRHHDGQPNIIRLPMSAPTPEEIHHNEELARRLDGKNPDGTRTELPVVTNSEQSGAHEPRVPGRLIGASAPVQSPNANPEQPNQALTEFGRQTPSLPETLSVGPDLDSDKKHKGLEPSRNQEAPAPVYLSDQQSSAIIPQTAPVPPKSDGVLAPAPVADQQSVSTNPALMPLPQTEQQPLESATHPDGQPLQAPITEQRLIEGQQAESIDINTQRRQQIDQLPQELTRRQDKQKQEEAQQTQQLEASRQQEMQNQQQMEMQRQEAQRAQEQAQQMQQQEAARQQEMQNQQQMEMQRQEAQRAQEQAQQMQQQEAARQQEMQNQQQIEMQQQAQRAQEQAQQMQQLEASRQQEMQNQQQIEMQRQEAQRAQEQAQQMQQQEAARQQELQNQQQMEMQQHQAQRVQEEAQQMQQQEAARQQELQNQQQMEMQRQEAQRAQEQAQQMQQQEAARQQEIQNQQQMEMQQQQDQRAQEQAQQMQQQEEARQQGMPNQQQMQGRQRPGRR